MPDRAAEAAASADDGWLPDVLRRPSPHVDERPAGVDVDLIVLHYISLPAGVFAGDAVERLFLGTLPTQDPPFESLRGLRVSSHLFIRRDGSVMQFASLHRRAWHAGLSNFRGRNACNDFSVGIELEGDSATAFADAQYAALSRVIGEVCRRHPIRWVTGHEVIAPGRKQDPGPMFDWTRMRAMLPHGVSAALAPTDCDRAMLAQRAMQSAG